MKKQCPVEPLSLVMQRKKWTPKTESSPSVTRFREKRKWQIALRRYVLEKIPSSAYAPYFGLDIRHLRSWFELQFTQPLSWDNFGTHWQFDHIVPVTYFDFSADDQLKLCWNFINLRVEKIQHNKDRGQRLDILAAKDYFFDLFHTTHYPLCQKMIEKIETIRLSELLATEAQKNFLTQNRDYLNHIRDYSSFEFDLLNRGRSLEDVQRELDTIRNIKF